MDAGNHVGMMKFGGWGGGAGAGWAQGAGVGGVRAMVDDQRRRKRQERQEEIKQGMAVPGKVVFRNVPYNMKEETLRCRFRDEALPDPLQVTPPPAAPAPYDPTPDQDFACDFWLGVGLW